LQARRKELKSRVFGRLPNALNRMSSIPPELRYAKSHEWLKLESDGTVTIGITDFAQQSLGDITYAQVPKIGTALKAGAVFGVVESVKAASDLYSPVSGVVVGVNTSLESTPEIVNRSPYGEGWMLKVKPDEPLQINHLLDSEAYARLAS